MSAYIDAVLAELIAAREALRMQRGAGGSPPVVGAATQYSDLIHVTIDLSAIGSHTLIAGISSQRIQVMEFLLWNVAQQDLEFKSGSKSWTGPLKQFPGQSGHFEVNVGEPHFDCDVGQPFQLVMSAATQVSGYLLYRTKVG